VCLTYSGIKTIYEDSLLLALEGLWACIDSDTVHLQFLEFWVQTSLRFDRCLRWDGSFLQDESRLYY
jgi:hypothetical protein